ncbi:hypothetical protein [Aliikangiella maris]|uniref:Uncharacterized protein n=2 Tax=Aliikangiella maris TaxID=3162458 RepID=A0ABV3MNL9_9GAMM
MPVGEVAGELLSGLFRLIGRFFVEIIFEILTKSTGYAICQIFSKRVDPDGVLVVVVGLSFLSLIGLLIFFIYEFLQLQMVIDSCLDSGGEFNYEFETCEQKKKD